MLFDYSSFLNSKAASQKAANLKSRLVILNSDKKFKGATPKSVTKSQLDDFKNRTTTTLLDVSMKECVLYVHPKTPTASNSLFSVYRDEVGAALRSLLARKPDQVSIEFLEVEDEALIGAIVGVELATYAFHGAKAVLPLFHFDKTIDKTLFSEAVTIAMATQCARHLTNLPPNRLNPRSFAQEIRGSFKPGKGWSVEIWNEARLKKEKMNLHVAVGAGSSEKSQLVILRYRNRAAKAHVALVGKGITFDSGGLDIKPAAGMRLMKKDMGGAAAVFGLAAWAKVKKPELNLDFYFCLSENSLDENAFRPGDIYTSRSGKTVEISNTDAEGRLVLADTLTLVSEGFAKKSAIPTQIIDIATLTGAGKIALGSDLASLFSNNDVLAEQLLAASRVTGDLCWRLPLYQPYIGLMKSSFADLENSASSGYGGAITAALFLENFVSHPSWAHLDIYAWKDSAGGAYGDKGGTGQSVQLLIEHLNTLSQTKMKAVKKSVRGSV